ncbi:uncharacterized protein LOC135473915 [Liolophura sinensis]|uniref:uncharacterized protein LOC135473915 n=1 Tax=Liolophura sinensis TaxID=3198878 RepID=UPI0031582186
MGAGASSSVKNIQIQSSNRNNDTEIKGKSIERQKVQRPLSPCTEDCDKTKNGDAAEQKQMLADLKKQLAATESEKLDLLDRIHLLEGQIEYLNTQHQLASQKSNCEETLHAKDQYIRQLEHETASGHEELTKLRVKHKKKVRFLSMRLAEAKQETSIHLLELKDVINRLTEENSSLHEKLHKCGTQGAKSHFAESNSQEDGRSKLVLELSQELNEQSDRIEELEKMLCERDQAIKTLQKSSKNKADHINCVNQKEKEDVDMTELKSLMAEMKIVQRQNKGKRQNGTGKPSSEMKDKGRGSSGQSRDSGLGSPGESHDHSEYRKDRPISSSSTVSGLSVGLADSDSCLQLEQEKVCSAPASHIQGKPPPSSRMKPLHMDNWNSDTEPKTNSLTAKRKKKFALKQRMDIVDVDDKPGTKLNTFIDSDCDM